MTLNYGVANTRTVTPAPAPLSSPTYVAVVGTNTTSGLAGYTVPAVGTLVSASSRDDPADAFGNAGTIYQAQLGIADAISVEMVAVRWNDALPATTSSEYGARATNIATQIDALGDSAADVGFVPDIIIVTGFECGVYTETAGGVRTYTTGASSVFTQLGSTCAALNAVGICAIPPFDNVTNEQTWLSNNSHARVISVASGTGIGVPGITGDEDPAPSVGGLMALMDRNRGNVGGNPSNFQLPGASQGSNPIRYNVSDPTSRMQVLIGASAMVLAQHPRRGFITNGGKLAGGTSPYDEINVLRATDKVEEEIAQIADVYLGSTAFTRAEQITAIANTTNSYLSTVTGSGNLFEAAECTPDDAYNDNTTNIAANRLRFQNTYTALVGTDVITFNHNVTL